MNGFKILGNAVGGAEAGKRRGETMGSKLKMIYIYSSFLFKKLVHAISSFFFIKKLENPLELVFNK